MDMRTQGLPTLSESRLSSILDTAVDGIIVIDETAKVLVFNKACEKLFGYTAKDVVGQNIKMLMPQDYAERHDEYMDNYIETGHRRIIGIGRAVHARHSSGEVIPIELSVGESNTPVGRQFVGILRDMRPKIEAEERLDSVQAQLVRIARVNAMDEMGSALAHELNQPLTALMLYLQAVSRLAHKPEYDGKIPQEIQDIIDRSLKEADRAGKIIQRMRQFVEKRETERQIIQLSELVDDALDFTMIGMRARGVTVERDYAPDLPPISVDPIQIQQIVVNLVRNALDAVRSSETKLIRVETRREGNHICAAVIDSGNGIDPEVVPDLFKAFTTTKRSGTGLGLAISKTIAQSHGGDLLVDPGGDGCGAQFCMYLPVAHDESTNGKTPAPSQS
ncbi:MAG: PAS domain S-box protein [Pseudomonadota bacterium]